MTPSPAQPPATLRVNYVEGVLPEKWFRRFTERTTIHLESRCVEESDQWTALQTGEVDVAFLRLREPLESETYHRVVLYSEQPGVAAPRGHEIAVVDSVTRAELDGEPLAPPQPTLRETLDLVAAGVGLCYAPRPALRFLNVDGVVHRELRDGDPTSIAVVWPKAQDSDLIQEFIGIVRGRRASSSRQPSAQASTQASAGRPRAAGSSRSGGTSGRGRGRGGSSQGRRGGGQFRRR